MTVNLGYPNSHSDLDSPDSALNQVKFSGNGGGRHYTVHNNDRRIDANLATRQVYIDHTKQPLTIYGGNLEFTKGGAKTDANVEIVGSQHVRWYGCKREGDSPSALIHDSSDIGLYGCGAMTTPSPTNKLGWFKVTGTSDNIVSALHVVRNSCCDHIGPEMVYENITGIGIKKTAPWPNGVVYYKRGEVTDDAFGGGGGTPPEPPPPPVLASLAVDAADRVDLCWQIFDSTPLLPASGVTGVEVKVDTVTTPIQSSTRQGSSCYELALPAGAVTHAGQQVTVSYTPGNITAGAPPNAPAVAFPEQAATNTLPPLTGPVQSQTAYGFRALTGSMTDVNWYQDSSGAFENIPARFVPGALFRLHMKVANNSEDAPSQAFSVCWEKNESGAYALLTDSCDSQPTCYANAPDLPAGEPTVELLTPTEPTFVPGALLESADSPVVIALPTDSETGIEAAIRIVDTATVGDRFRYHVCTDEGEPLNGGYGTGGDKNALVTIISPKSTSTGGGTSQ
jgi:hypothetical protein